MTATTTYTVQLKNSNGYTGPVSAEGTITVNPLPTVTAVTSPAICYNTKASLTATLGSSGTTTAMTYTWKIGVTSATNTSNTITTSASLTTTTTYTVQVKNANNCTGLVSATGTITVWDNFSAGAINPGNGTATAGTNPDITIGSSSDASGGGDGTITYEWRRDGTPITGSNSPSYTIGSHSPGTYTFIRYAKNGTCNTSLVASTGIYTLTVKDEPWKSCGSGLTDISNNQSEGAMHWSPADDLCRNKDGGSGWRLPSRDELECMCNNKESLPGGYVGDYYWSSSSGGSNIHKSVGFGSNCEPYDDDDNAYHNHVKCVKDACSELPAFSAGTISSGSVTVTPGTDPGITIDNSTSASGGDGNITYEWRRDGIPLTGSNSTSYSIGSDADNYSTPGTYTFTRWAKDGTCNTDWVASTGAYTLTVKDACDEFPAFSAGAIDGGSATVTADTNPNITIDNSSDASGGDGTITYEWRRNDTPLTGSNSPSYTIGSDASDYSTEGTYTFTRWAKDGACTDWMASTDTYTLTVNPPDYVIWTACSGFTRITKNQYEGTGKMIWGTAEKYCIEIGIGWRLPTLDELECICQKKDNPALPGGYEKNDYYWSITTSGSNSHNDVYFSGDGNCYVTSASNYSASGYVKCVKD
jgi:hypothetical protein